MVTVKRDDPFTPVVAKGKKQRDYASPIVNRTPLRSCAGSMEALNDPIQQPNFLEYQVPLKGENPTKRAHAAFQSPVVGPSPKAFPLGSSPYVNSSSHKSPRSLSTANPLALPPQSNAKLSVEQMNKTFEEWIKIAADNVKWD